MLTYKLLLISTDKINRLDLETASFRESEDKNQCLSAQQCEYSLISNSVTGLADNALFWSLHLICSSYQSQHLS